MTAGIFVLHFVSFHGRPGEANETHYSWSNSPNLLVTLPSRKSFYCFRGMRGQLLINSDTSKRVVFLLKAMLKQLLTAPTHVVDETQMEVSSL